MHTYRERILSTVRGSQRTGSIHGITKKSVNIKEREIGYIANTVRNVEMYKNTSETYRGGGKRLHGTNTRRHFKNSTLTSCGFQTHGANSTHRTNSGRVMQILHAVSDSLRGFDSSQFCCYISTKTSRTRHSKRHFCYVTLSGHDYFKYCVFACLDQLSGREGLGV